MNSTEYVPIDYVLYAIGVTVIVLVATGYCYRVGEKLKIVQESKTLVGFFQRIMVAFLQMIGILTLINGVISGAILTSSIVFLIWYPSLFLLAVGSVYFTPVFADNLVAKMDTATIRQKAD